MEDAKKKLHEMVEALINGDSKTAATALHNYLQVKTRSILGEEDMEDDMVADRHEDSEEHDDVDHEEMDHEDSEECPECGMSPCECEDSEEHDDVDHEEMDHEEMDHEDSEEHMHESNLTMAKKGHYEKNTAKLLDRKVKGTTSFDKTSASGSKRSDSGMRPTKMHKNSMGAKGLESKVKGKLKFDKSSGTKSSDSGAPKKTAMHKNSMGAKGLESKVKGAVKFSSSKARTNNV